MAQEQHIPVLLQEVVEALQPQSGQTFIDCTYGGGGHSSKLAKIVGSKGNVIGIDNDPKVVVPRAKNISITHSNFDKIKKVAKQHGVELVDGVLFDLGLSSMQLDDPEQGFSFNSSGLDMRFNWNSDEVSATEIIRNWPEKKLAEIFKNYGEERLARPIAKAIVEKRKVIDLTNGKALAELISQIYKRFYRSSYSRIHPATKVFQALRIAVNDELSKLEKALQDSIDILQKDGRIAVISYHSLEDRIVKRLFMRESKDCICPTEVPVCVCRHKSRIKRITRKPIIPSQAEIEKNPRSRSAKLRVAQKK